MDELLACLEALMGVDSTTGFFRAGDAFFLAEAERLGLPARQLNKGGVQVELGGEGSPIVIAAHMDAIGLMVRAIRSDGSIQLAPIGGLHPYYALDANVRLYARGGRVYTGVVRRTNPSVHLMTVEEAAAKLEYETNVALVLDEIVHTKEDTERLGVCCGDGIALEPQYRVTESGFVKSRFLDDKASCACLLLLMREAAAGRLKLARRVTLLFSAYEEIGHGGACGIPGGTRDFLAVDIGCVGPGHDSDEQKVSICVKDAAFPYHTEFTTELVDLCKAHGIPYALDMFLPRYGSDADAALRAGYDVRHALIGPGVLETHGYERTHKDALDATYRLIRAVVS